MADSEHWLRKNWTTLVALLFIFALALFLRVYFVYGLAMPDRLVSGGSDSFYYERIIEHAFLTGEQLVNDPLLNYPMGLTNPRPPLFAWWSLLSGWIVSPLFPSPWSAITYSFILSTAIFGALTVFPTYALVKEAFNRRAGLIAAFLLAVSPAHLQRSMASNADHDAFVLFFVVTGYFFFLRALESMNEKRWVESWRKPAAIRAGVGQFFRENRASVLYSLMAAMSIAAVALTWQGWAYAPIILLVYFVIQLLFHRIRNRDPMGITILFGITMGVAMLVAAPWYTTLNQVKVWFDVPAYLFGAAMVLAVLFTVTRDYPWALVIPTVVGASSIALGVGMYVNPALANAFLSGAGYFVQTKLYETIAEAQAPPLSQIILSFGWGTYFLTLGALAYLLWQFVTGRRTQTAYLFFVVWTLAAVIMAQAAARFIFNASPAFAATAGYAIALIVERLDYDGMKRTYRSIAPGSRRAAIRKSVKPRHVIGGLVLVFLLFLPNVWWAVDASIPFESKLDYDRQIYDLTPGPLRPPDYEALTQGRNPFYLGAFGFSLPESKEYFPAAWEWLSEQDSGDPPARRPAFLSWWDYGFEAADKGRHPTVADNFQNGYHLAGNFISAQGEDEAIALLSLRLIEGDFYANGRAFSPPVRAALTAFGIDVDSLEIAYRDPAGLVPTIKGDPERYGHYDDRMQATNALYIYGGDLLTSVLGTDRQADLYAAIRQATGKSIRYFAVDARLFPASPSDTGIFYAPIKLSDHRVIELPDGRVLPTDFFRIFVTVGRSRTAIEDLGPFDRPDDPRGTIEYQDMFYKSMFYRTYVGPRPSEILTGSGNLDDGIPGLSGQRAQSVTPMPAWNLSHWRLVYRTAYHNPFNDTTNHSEDWRALNFFDALRLQQNITAGKATGIVDLSMASVYTQGIVFVKYYDGAYVNGTVTVGGHVPVPGLQVTVSDELEVPHYEARTDAEGRFSVLVPFGDVTLTVSTGAINPATRVGAQELQSVRLTVTDDAAMRRNVDADGDGRPDWLVRRDIAIPGGKLSGRVFLDIDGNAAFDEGRDILLPGASLTLRSRDLGIENSTTVGPDGRYEIRDVVRGTTWVNVSSQGRRYPLVATDLSGTDAARDFSIPGLALAGRVADRRGQGVPDAEVAIRDKTNGTTIRARTNATGSYLVPALLVGDYEARATAGDLASLPAIVTLGAVAPELNLTVYPSGTVSGTTFVGGNVQPYTTVEFDHLSDGSLRAVITSDGTGRYTASLPEGRWSVMGRHYVNGRLFAALGTLEVHRGQAVTFSPTYLEGVDVRGIAYSETASNVSRAASVIFRSDTGSLHVGRTSNFGAYVAYLPKGTYDVEAVNQDRVFLERRTFDASTTLNLPLVFRAPYASTVYRDLNRNDARDAGEGLSGIEVAFRDDLGRTLTMFTVSDGSFSAPLDGTRTWRVDIAAAGYEPEARGPATVDELRREASIPLTALNVTVSGTLLRAGAPVGGTAIAVQFLGTGGGGLAAQEFADGQGRYAISLQPGTYEVIVDENVTAGDDRMRWQNAGEDRLEVEVAALPITADLDVVQRARVRGSVTLGGNPADTVVTFEGPDEVAVSTSLGRFEVFLATGAYDVQANQTVGARTFLFADSLSITGPVDLSMPLSEAVEVGGLVTVEGAAFPEPLDIAFSRSEGGSFRAFSDPAGGYRLDVLDGSYTVTMDERTTTVISGVSRFIRITFLGALAVVPGGTAVLYDIAAVRTFDNSTVSGRVTAGAAGVPAAIRFSERATGAMNATATTASDGSFSVGLHPGTYNVHVVAAGPPRAFLASLAVPHGQSVSLNPALVPAFTVSGVTTYKGGVRIAADITFTGIATAYVRSDGHGDYAITLPPGNYAITARVSETVNGVTVIHARATSLALFSSPDPLNLALDRVARRQVQLAWNDEERQAVPAGASVAYTVRLTNSGNIEDEYTLSGTPAGWTFTFDRPRVSLNFGTGGNATDVAVTIRTPTNALVDHGPITITARSTRDSGVQGSVNVEVDVLRHRGISVSVTSAVPTFDGRFLNYTLTVTNTGNARETVAMVIPNLSELASRGWVARLAPPVGGDLVPELRNVSVDGNATRSVTIVFESRGGSSGTTAVVKAFAEDLQTLESSQTFRLDLPALSVIGRITASGSNVVSDLELPFGLTYPLVAVLVTVLACITAGLVLTPRRKR